MYTLLNRNLTNSSNSLFIDKPLKLSLIVFLIFLFLLISILFLKEIFKLLNSKLSKNPSNQLLNEHMFLDSTLKQTSSQIEITNQNEPPSCSNELAETKSISSICFNKLQTNSFNSVNSDILVEKISKNSSNEIYLTDLKFISQNGLFMIAPMSKQQSLESLNKKKENLNLKRNLEKKIY